MEKAVSLKEKQLFYKRCQRRLSLWSIVNLHDAQGDAGGDFAVNRNVDRVITSLFKTKTLEIHDEVAGEEGSSFRKSDMKVADDGHAFRVESLAIFVNNADSELVIAFVFRSEANADSERAGRVYNRELAGKQGVKCTLHAEFALVVGSEVTKSRYLEIHDEIRMCAIFDERTCS